MAHKFNRLQFIHSTTSILDVSLLSLILNSLKWSIMNIERKDEKPHENRLSCWIPYEALLYYRIRLKLTELWRSKNELTAKKKRKINNMKCVLNIKTCLEGRAITSVVFICPKANTVSLLIKIDFYLIDMCSIYVWVCVFYHTFDVWFSVFVVFCQNKISFLLLDYRWIFEDKSKSNLIYAND